MFSLSIKIEMYNFSYIEERLLISNFRFSCAIFYKTINIELYISFKEYTYSNIYDSYVYFLNSDSIITFPYY